MKLLCVFGWHNEITRGRYVHGRETVCLGCGRVRFKPWRVVAAMYGAGPWLSPNGPKGKETLGTVEETR
ncbi:hypothetical protein LCGC14_2615660 [marine sediment metagenome]|uniref:Uncharacterized protein n=1 Tax=marine sediment metagenome TaxID=412755 RepID=A0A0F9A4T8_9ZZZZ